MITESDVIASFPGDHTGREIRVTVIDFHGRMRVDVRVWRQEGERFHPDSKGFRFPPEKIDVLCKALEEAAAVAQKRAQDRERT